MTTVEAMKQLLCYIRNDGTTYEDISETNATNVWVLIGEAFNERFNNGSSSEQPSGSGTTTPLGELTVTSAPGETLGTTRITVSGASGSDSIFRYKVDGNVSSYGEDLSTWNVWDVQETLAVEDGAHICVAEVDSNSKAIAVGHVTASVKLI